MDKLTHYRQLIRQLLNEYAQMKPSNGDIQVYTFFDVEGDHYQVFHAGWDGYQRIFGR
ncbi:MAG: element excision factor XisI family protein [Nostocaceae cyanobacterium]|nr:element excision factor XisI family protein [Nostocaceae cyanobacterium]